MSRVAVALLALGLFLFFNPPIALGHATPMVYEPAASSVQQTAPPRVRIKFSERIEPKASGITILGPDGSRADNNDSAPETDDPRVFSVGVREAGEGEYTVSWQVVSQDDGHFTKGAFAFSVGKNVQPSKAAPDPIQVEHSSTLSQAGAIGTELAGQAMLLGTLMAILLLWPSLPLRRVSPIHQAAFERVCGLLVILGATLLIAGVSSYLVLKTIDLQASRGTGFVLTLQTFLTTVDGRFAVYRAILGILFTGIFFITRKRILGSARLSWNTALLIGFLVLMALARARVSHAAASHLLPTFSVLINAVHLLAKEFWVGGLIAITLLLMPLLSRNPRGSVTALVLSAFSKYASIALAVTGVTGAYIVWLHLKSLDYLTSSQWGSRSVILLALAGLLGAFRLYHQLLGDRCVLAAAQGPLKGYSREVVTALRHSIPAEMGLGLAVLFVSSYLIITTPPYPPAHFALEKEALSNGSSVLLSATPHEQDQFLVTIEDEKTGNPLAVSDAVITLRNDERNIGPVVAETVHRFEGGFTFARQSLSVPGVWTIDVAAQRPDSYDVVASFHLEYPRELEQSRVSGDQRQFGLFEAMAVLAAIGSLIVSLLLYRYSKRLVSKCRDVSERHGLNELGFTPFRSIPTAAISIVIASAGVWLLYEGVVKTEFQKVCEGDHNTWVQSVPMREGVALSPDAVTGCTINRAASHFADLREYKYFKQQKGGKTEHKH